VPSSDESESLASLAPCESSSSSLYGSMKENCGMDGNALRYEPLVTELAPVMHTSCSLEVVFDINAVKAAMGSSPRSDLGIWRLRRAGTMKTSGTCQPNRYWCYPTSTIAGTEG